MRRRLQLRTGAAYAGAVVARPAARTGVQSALSDTPCADAGAAGVLATPRRRDLKSGLRMAAVTATGLTKRYANRNAVAAVDLEVGRGK